MRWKDRRSGFVVILSIIVNVKRLRFCISILYKLQYELQLECTVYEAHLISMDLMSHERVKKDVASLLTVQYQST